MENSHTEPLPIVENPEYTDIHKRLYGKRRRMEEEPPRLFWKISLTVVIAIASALVFYRIFR